MLCLISWLLANICSGVLLLHRHNQEEADLKLVCVEQHRTTRRGSAMLSSSAAKFCFHMDSSDRKDGIPVIRCNQTATLQSTKVGAMANARA